MSRNIDYLIDICEDELNDGDVLPILIKASNNFEDYRDYVKFIDCLNKCDVGVKDYTVYFTGEREFRFEDIEKV